MTKKAKHRSFREYLMEVLADPSEAAEYINAVLAEKDVDFLLTALRDVAEAQGGMSHLARMTKLNRANLYQALSSHGDPRVHTLEAVLKVFGLRLGVLPDTMQHAA